MTQAITPKTLIALTLLEGTSPHDTRSAKVLARKLWPEKLKDCASSLRRGGYYRAAGAYYSRLQRMGLVRHWITDFDAGYYLSDEGKKVLQAHQASTQSEPKGEAS